VAASRTRPAGKSKTAVIGAAVAKVRIVFSWESVAPGGGDENHLRRSG
jgi:hypothetical protein